MTPVNVERVNSVFHLFAVDTSDAQAVTATAPGGISELYIPTHFLAVAAREVGYYPTSSAVFRFITTVEGAAAGVVTFAAFLQFCEDVAHTNQLGRSLIYKMVDNIDPRGCEIISCRDLYLLLTSGSANITEGELNAIMELLDPTNCGHVQLNDLAAVLIDACEGQQSVSRSQSRLEHPRQREQEKQLSVADTRVSTKQSRTMHHSASKTAAGVTFRAGPQASALQQRHRQKRVQVARQSHARQINPQPEDCKPHPKEEETGAPKRRGCEALPSAAAAVKEGGAQKQGHYSSFSAVHKCDSSLKAKEMRSASEMCSELCGGLSNQHDSLEHTHTTITVDLDVQLSIHQSTEKVRREALSPKSSTIIPLMPHCLPQPVASATAAAEAPPHEGAEEGGKPCLNQGHSAEVRIGARGGGDSQKSQSVQPEYFGREPPTTHRSLSMASGRSSVAKHAPVAKEKVPKCCIIL
ncbi:hypothetical protein JKF63_01151 [Porcisia hertigi]|uniref:EF-hand domain-containing protein n=1 Tax=Porcisia hertigi TaxID=2761500 RepID=A0A836HU64_9TRYP|nr:hypothetical protein JKF63_01151 [Porcisia hertigi]